MKYKIKKVVRTVTDRFGQAGRIEYHILRALDDSLLDIELTYAQAIASMYTYENLKD